MKKYLKLIYYLASENYKTIYFNFKYFSFKDAIIFPVILSRNVFLKDLKGKVVFETGLRYGIVKIGFGDIGIFDHKKSRSILQLHGTVIFRGSAQIGHGSKLSVGSGGCLVFGSNFKITAESSIVSHSNIEIGANCLLSWEVLIMDTDFHAIRDLETKQLNLPEKILIGNNVWIGCRATILKGSEIPDNSVIGAGSLVNSKFTKEDSIYTGVPARLVKENIVWTNK